MKNFIQPGNHIEITAPAAITSGQGVLIGQLFGVASTDIANGETGTIVTEGVFDLPKVSGALSVGDVVRWNDSTNQITTTTSFKQIGVVVEDAASGDATVRVKLYPTVLDADV